MGRTIKARATCPRCRTPARLTDAELAELAVRLDLTADCGYCRKPFSVTLRTAAPRVTPRPAPPPEPVPPTPAAAPMVLAEPSPEPAVVGPAPQRGKPVFAPLVPDRRPTAFDPETPPPDLPRRPAVPPPFAPRDAAWTGPTRGWSPGGWWKRQPKSIQYAVLAAVVVGIAVLMFVPNKPKPPAEAEAPATAKPAAAAPKPAPASPVRRPRMPEPEIPPSERYGPPDELGPPELHGTPLPPPTRETAPAPRKSPDDNPFVQRHVEVNIP